MPTMQRTAAASLRALMAGTLDYAGLFPPASLEMSDSVANYARYREHAQRWLLGRFVLPASRFEEFLAAHEQVVPLDEDEVRTDAGPDEAVEHPWRLSGILFASDELAVVEEYNRGVHGAVFESVELLVSTPEEIEDLHPPPESRIRMFFEIPVERAGELLPLIRSAGGCAKLRMGGVAAEAFPSVEEVAEFVAQCAELGVPFKATAGLHHALRGSYALTYAADSPRAKMHGFLNLFTAAAIAWCSRRSGGAVSREALAACLADTERLHWDFTEVGLSWIGQPLAPLIDLNTLAEVRTKFALNFGSCSFEEPVDELGELKLL
jgi:hypothetical protein